MPEIKYSLMCGGYMSDRTYADQKHAEAVAKELSAITGQKWEVRKLEVRK